MQGNTVTLTAEQAMKLAEGYNVIAQLNLDNLITEDSATKSTPEGGYTDMARLRERVYLSDGTTKWATGMTKQELFMNVAKILAPMLMTQTVQDLKGSKITLKEFVEDQYKPTYMKTIKATTQETYRQYLELYIYRYLGNMIMTDINVKTVQDFYNWMAEGSKHGMKKDINAGTISRVGGLLTRIFSIAEALDYIKETPMKKALLSNHGEKAKHHTALTLTAITRVRKGIPKLTDEQERLFMALLAYTGMRPEEILGLRWEEVFTNDGYANMVRTVTYPTKTTPEVKEEGKTDNSIRSIILVPAVVNILNTATQKEGYVIHGKDINTPCPRTTYVKLYKKAFEALGIKEYTPYDFRSNFATECVENGMTSKQVADMMGHADTRMVERVYATKRNEGILKNKESLASITAEYAI